MSMGIIIPMSIIISLSLNLKTMELPYRNKITSAEINPVLIDFYRCNSGSFKPLGFWYAINDGWKKFWYDDEKMDIIDNKFIYEILINSRDFTTDLTRKNLDKILIIKDPQHLEAFVKKYGAMFDEKYNLIEKSLKKDFDIYSLTDLVKIGINWKLLESHYAGFELNFYDERFRPMLWYGAFDCASGSIWKPSKIVKFNLITSN